MIPRELIVEGHPDLLPEARFSARPDQRFAEEAGAEGIWVA